LLMTDLLIASVFEEFRTYAVERTGTERVE
jgi:hypothetical protein